MTPFLTQTYNPSSDIIVAWGLSMKGIRAVGKCPKCHKPFIFDPSKMIFICRKHLTTPKRYLVDFHYKGERFRRETDLDGRPLLTASDARRLLDLAEREKQAHIFDPKKWRHKGKSSFAFDTLVNAWYDDKLSLMNDDQRAPSYVPKLRTYIHRFYLPIYGERDVREIQNLDELVKFLREYRKTENPGKGEPLSLKYRKNVIDALQHFFRYIQRKNRLHIPYLPEFPDKIPVPDHDPQTISRDIQLLILNEVPDEHKPIFTWLFYQGCRPAEARGLKGDAIIDLKEPRDTVVYKRGFSAGKLRNHTKTKRDRPNYIYPEVRAELPDIIHRDEFIFTHGIHKKRPYSAAFLNKIYRDALAAFNTRHNADLNIELYEATKHSFGTQMINTGTITAYDLKLWYGHTKIEQTEKYAKLNVVEVFRKQDNVVPVEQAISTLRKRRQ